jgi:predicted ATPase
MIEPFSKICIENFRRLRHVCFQLPQLTALIGANGSGKTSFLDALFFMSRAAGGGLQTTLSNAGGIDQVLTAKSNSIPRAEAIKLGASQKNLRYAIQLQPQGNSFLISHESLFEDRGKKEPFKHIESMGTRIRYFDQKKLVEPTWRHDSLETSLYQVPRMFDQPERFRHSLSSAVYYHTLDVGPRAPVRLPQQMRPAASPGLNGEDLVSCLYFLRETNPDAFHRIIETMQVVFPGFQRLDFPPVAAGTISMTWRDERFAQPFFTSQLSEGTLRFLWLTTVLLTPTGMAITLIDEPEVSLHPEMLRALADLLRDAALRSQVVVATHSDRLISFLHPGEVAVAESNEDGTTQIKSASDLDLAEWLDEYTLGDLWKKGLLGARA